MGQPVPELHLGHHRLNQAQMYRLCYGLLVVTAVKLLWDGLAGYAGAG